MINHETRANIPNITSDQPICFRREMTLFFAPRREMAPQLGHLKTSLGTYFPHLPQYAMNSHFDLIPSRSTYVYIRNPGCKYTTLFWQNYPPPVKKR